MFTTTTAKRRQKISQHSSSVKSLFILSTVIRPRACAQIPLMDVHDDHGQAALEGVPALLLGGTTFQVVGFLVHSRLLVQLQGDGRYAR